MGVFFITSKTIVCKTKDSAMTKKYKNSHILLLQCSGQCKLEWVILSWTRQRCVIEKSTTAPIPTNEFLTWKL